MEKKSKVKEGKTCGECGGRIRKGALVAPPRPDAYGWKTECPHCDQEIYLACEEAAESFAL